MEKKDYLTLAVSILALVVSIASAVFTYRADRRAEQLTKPLVTGKVTHPELRDWLITVTVKNRSQSPIQIQEANLVEPKGGFLLPRRDVNGLEKEQVKDMTMYAMREKPDQIRTKEVLTSLGEATMYFQVSLPERSAVPDNTNLRMILKIGFGNEFKSPEIFAVTNTE